MASTLQHDKSNRYEQLAETFIRTRDRRIGAVTVREWSKTLPPASSILDLGCGHGLPISQVLINDGFAVYGVDAFSEADHRVSRTVPQSSHGMLGRGGLTILSPH